MNFAKLNLVINRVYLHKSNKIKPITSFDSIIVFLKKIVKKKKKKSKIKINKKKANIFP